MSYLKIRKADLHSSVKVDVPDVEAFVIYTGKKKVEKDVLSLNQEFFYLYDCRIITVLMRFIAIKTVIIRAIYHPKRANSLRQQTVERVSAGLRVLGGGVESSLDDSTVQVE